MVSTITRNLGFLTRYASNRILAHGRILSVPQSNTRVTLQPSQSYLYSTLTKVLTCADYRTILPISHVNNNLIQKRFKKRKGKSTKDDEEEEEDDEEDLSQENPLLMDDLQGEDDGSFKMVVDVNSLRLDVVTKAALVMTRAKVEDSFYKGDIYVNGERPGKKSVDVSLNDEIDVVKNINIEDNRLIDIKRAVITSIPDKQNEHGRLKIGIKRWMDLTIPRHGKQTE